MGMKKTSTEHVEFSLNRNKFHEAGNEPDTVFGAGDLDGVTHLGEITTDSLELRRRYLDDHSASWIPKCSESRFIDFISNTETISCVLASKTNVTVGIVLSLHRDGVIALCKLEDLGHGREIHAH